MKEKLRTLWRQSTDWLLKPEHQHKARALRADVERAFTEHPHETGETYFEHLCFTLKMSGRFIYTLVVLIIHGVFPFLLTKAASQQIEKVYGIMKSRIPKSRRDVIDADYQV